MNRCRRSIDADQAGQRLIVRRQRDIGRNAPDERIVRQSPVSHPHAVVLRDLGSRARPGVACLPSARVALFHSRIG